jgi:hypothetical protein
MVRTCEKTIGTTSGDGKPLSFAAVLAIRASSDNFVPLPESINGIQAKKNTMSAPVKYGDEWKLTVKNRLKDNSAPPSAAIRPQRPTSVPIPIAISDNEMMMPRGFAYGSK